MKAIGLPFWLAGGAGSPEALQQALSVGASGIQVGTLMAFCEESGMAPELRQRTLEAAVEGRLSVYTDPQASPTGYPFKIVEIDHVRTPAQPRTRRCDLGYLRTPYRLADGRIAHRCSAEPVATYVAKGGDAADTQGRRCLCNALLATAGHAQVRRDGTEEQPIVTAGDQARDLARFLNGRTHYAAADVLQYLTTAPASRWS
jgi:NAD(P)H-dependent flavin oxidoreductase YrpB (nitropropane dioxygenase family)